MTGPCLFLAYINDLPDRVSSNARLFAAVDTAVDRKILSSSDKEQLQADIDAISKLEEEWDMSFPPDKCQVLHVTNKISKAEVK